MVTSAMHILSVFWVVRVFGILEGSQVVDDWIQVSVVAADLT